MSEIKDILSWAELADFRFLAKIMESYVSLSADSERRSRIDDYQGMPTELTKDSLAGLLDRDIRYLGSSDIAYLARRLRGNEPGISANELIEDVAAKLKVKLKPGSFKARLERFVKAVAEREFAKLNPEEQRETIEQQGLGTDMTEEVMRQIKRKGRFGILGVVLAVAGEKVVAKLLANLAINLTAAFISREADAQRFKAAVTKFPWRAELAGPIVWTVSVGWLAFGLQGPAYRKTVPCLLYLGIIALRNGPTDGEQFWDTPNEE